MTPRQARWQGAAFFLILATASCVTFRIERAQAHNPITSKFTFNDDIFPIMRDRCGRCHVPDGVAPMSLMTYKDAFPWGESLRAELIAGHMPPWNAQSGPIAFKNAPAITAAEVDKILTWATGRTPQGDPQKVLPPVTLQHGWPAGKPDLTLDLPSTTLAIDSSEATQEFTIPANTTVPEWIRAVDLLPGTPAIVRNAIISVKPRVADKAQTGGLAPERVLAVWVPGDYPVSPEHAAFLLEPGTELIVRVHYLKTYANDGKKMTDQSKIGLYFADSPSEEIQRLEISSAPVSAVPATPLVFDLVVDQDLQALAFNPDPTLTNAGLQVDTVSPTGTRTSVIRMAARPNWARRYWFEQPLALPRGTKIEVRAVLNGADPLLPPTGTALPPQVVNGSPVRLAFDVVPKSGPGAVR